MGFSKVTGLENIMFADNASFDGTERSGAMTANGQIWIGSAVSPHVRLSTLTAGAGIAITNGTGSITIATLAGGFQWNNISVNTAAVVENGYRASAALTLTLPNAPGDGATIKVQSRTASAVVVKAQGADTIRLGNTQGAAAGTATTTGIGQNLELVYDNPNNNWVAQSYVGNWTVA